MEQRKEELLKFNNRIIPYTVVDGVTYIAIRPICDALGVDYHRQYKNLKKDKILDAQLAIQPMRGSETPMRNYAALPEKYIYGWLFSINSNVAALQEYKKKCYDVLYNYFNGSIIRRNELLKKKAKVLTEMRSLEEELKDNQKYQELNRLKGEMLSISNLLKKIDEQQANRQMTIFNS